MDLTEQLNIPSDFDSGDDLDEGAARAAFWIPKDPTAGRRAAEALIQNAVELRLRSKKTLQELNIAASSPGWRYRVNAVKHQWTAFCATFGKK